MPHPRSLIRLVTLAVAAAAIGGVPAAADAKEWSGPRKSANWSGPRVTAYAVPGAFAGAGVDLQAGAVSTDALEDAMISRINEARAANGLRKIWDYDPCTDQLAEEWGQRIARTGAFEHRDQNDVIRQCNNSWAGETLVRGVGLTPDVMVDLWLESPGHREILLNPRARRAGVSIEQDAQGRMIGVLNLVRRS